MSDPSDPAGPIRELKARITAENARRGLRVVKFGYDPSDDVAPDEITLVLAASGADVATPVEQLEADASFERIVADSATYDATEAAAAALADLRRRIDSGGDLFDPEDP